MSAIRTAFRSGAVWFLPLLFALSCVFASRSTVQSGYPAADLAQASVGLYAAAPLTAAFTAFQLRGFIAFLRPLRMARPGLLAVLRAWWPLLAGAPVTLCLATMTTARALPNDTAAWSIIGIDFMTVLAAGLTALLASWAFPVVVAVPLLGVLWFTWIGYGPASTNVVVHNLASTFGCCSPDTQPATPSVTATLTMLTLICAGSAALLLTSRAVRAPRQAVALVLPAVMVSSFAAGLTVLRTSDTDLNLTATQARTTPLSCRTQAGLRVCVWPENVEQAGTLAEIARNLNVKLVAEGLDPIKALTQGERADDAIHVEAGDLLAEEDLRAGVAYGYVAHATGCIEGRGRAFASAVAFTSVLAGLSRDGVESRYGTGSADALLQNGEALRPGAVKSRVVV